MQSKHRKKSRKLKVKSLGVTTLLTFTFSLSSLTAQSLFLPKDNGSQAKHDLKNIRKITFSSGRATVWSTYNSNYDYALNGLKNLNFYDFTVGLEEQTQFSTANLVTYPNPVGDVLNIDLSNSENRAGIISIHSLEGKVVQQQKINETGIVKLNLGQLPRGIYLCRYATETEIKTSKIIKQ